MTDLGNYYPPLSRSRREGILRACCVHFPSCRSRRVSFRSAIASISGVCALRSTASGSASWFGYSTACPLRQEGAEGVGACSFPSGHGERGCA